jgi:hypothetical protein
LFDIAEWLFACHLCHIAVRPCLHAEGGCVMLLLHLLSAVYDLNYVDT